MKTEKLDRNDMEEFAKFCLEYWSVEAHNVGELFEEYERMKGRE